MEYFTIYLIGVLVYFCVSVLGHIRVEEKTVRLDIILDALIWPLAIIILIFKD